jgi:HSP20 family protein
MGLEDFERRLVRLLDPAGFGPPLPPAADVYETDEEYVIELEVPGYEEAELGIEVTDHTLKVVGEREEKTEKEDKTFRIHERLEHEFERRFKLPPEADTEHVKAVFGKGVLTVHAPKLQITEPKKIAISKS